MTTTTTVKTTKPTKATLKKITAEKRAIGQDDEADEGYLEEDHCREARDRQEAKKAAGKKNGVGIFAPKKLSDALAAICGGKTMPRTEVTKKIWVYIKKNNLNQGRIIKPDAKLKAIFPVSSIDMLKMPGYISKHLS